MRPTTRCSPHSSSPTPRSTRQRRGRGRALVRARPVRSTAVAPRARPVCAAGPGRAPLSLICIGAYPGVSRFDGLGQLSVAQLRGLFPERNVGHTGAAAACGRRLAPLWCWTIRARSRRCSTTTRSAALPRGRRPAAARGVAVDPQRPVTHRAPGACGHGGRRGGRRHGVPLDAGDGGARLHGRPVVRPCRARTRRAGLPLVRLDRPGPSRSPGRRLC